MSRSAWVVAVSIGLVTPSGCWLDETYKHRGPTVPAELDDGWVVGTPESVGIDPAALAAVHDDILREDRHFGALALLVVKDGVLVFETYLRSLADRDRVHALQSATKSTTSLVWGAVLEDGGLPPLDTTLCSIVGDACDGLEPAKHEITLGDLFTMRSGIAFDNDDFSLEMMTEHHRDALRTILGKPMYAAPGEEFYYRDADPQLVSYALQTLRGRTMESLGEELLFAPMGIREHIWEALPDGTSTGAFALHLRPRDFAKLGQLVLDDGVWNGTRLVASDWCDDAMTAHVQTRDLPPNDRIGYGYYFWVTTTPPGWAFWGHGGQFALIVPAQRLVLVQVARPDTSGDDVHGGQLAHFVELTRPLWQ